MPLALFPLVLHRWKPAALNHDEYQAYTHLVEYLPQDVFNERMATLTELVRKDYPNVWPDTYMFLAAIVFVIATAIFSIVLRDMDIPRWYPLLILIAPAILAYLTTRRRGGHYLKLTRFHDKLQTCLKDMTSQDVTRHVKWDYRRLRNDDTAHDLHLPHQLVRYHVGLVIEAIQVDPETNLLREMGESLPAYHLVTHDAVLDSGPAIGSYERQTRHIPQEEIDLTDCHTASSLSLEPPPLYHHHTTIEMDTLPPPPAYQDPLSSVPSSRPPPAQHSNPPVERAT